MKVGWSYELAVSFVLVAAVVVLFTREMIQLYKEAKQHRRDEEILTRRRTAEYLAAKEKDEKTRELLGLLRHRDYETLTSFLGLNPGAEEWILRPETTYGETALILAVQWNDRRMVKFLLEHGANPLHTDWQGQPPREWIEWGVTDSEIVRLLEEAERKTFHD